MQCFTLKFTNILRTPFFTESLRWQLLKMKRNMKYSDIIFTKMHVETFNSTYFNPVVRII